MRTGLFASGLPWYRGDWPYRAHHRGVWGGAVRLLFDERLEDAPREVTVMPLRLMVRLAMLAAGAFITMGTAAFAQSAAETEKPVTPPDSYRVVMENDRMRMIELHIKAHSKIEVDTPPNRERFLYMLTDGALVLAAPGKKPYEFALNAGETAVFPPVSPIVENDTDSAVRALMVEIKEGSGRAVAGADRKGRIAGKRGGRAKVAVRSSGKSKAVKSAKPVKMKTAAKPVRPKAAVAKGPKPPLNLSKAASRPAKKVTGKGRGSDG
jgi:hypothetical protein